MSLKATLVIGSASLDIEFDYHEFSPGCAFIGFRTINLHGTNIGKWISPEFTEMLSEVARELVQGGCFTPEELAEASAFCTSRNSPTFAAAAAEFAVQTAAGKGFHHVQVPTGPNLGPDSTKH